MKKDYVRDFKVSSLTEKVVSVRILNDGWVDIKTDCDASFLISPKNTKVVPKVGDEITFYTILLTKVVGLELNGKLLYWLSDKEIFNQK